MKRILKILFIICLCFLLAGCWNNRDITEMAVVVAVGIDKVEDQYQVSVQIIKPSSLKGSGGGGGGGGGDNSEKKSNVAVISAIGDTVFDGIRNLLTMINNRAFFGQTKVIVFSEEAAKEGIANVLDLFERDTEFKYRNQIIISKDISASDLLTSKSDLDAISASHIEGILKNSNSIGKTKPTTLLELAQKLQLYGQQTVISVIVPKTKKEKYDMEDLIVQRGAVFLKDKLVGYLDSNQLRGYLFTQNNITSTIIVVENPEQNIKKASIEIKNTNAKMDVQKNNNSGFVYNVKLHVDANLGSQSDGQGELTDDDLYSLSQQCSKKIEDEIRAAFDISRKLGADIFGFGEVIHRKHPEEWKEIKHNWEEIYPENDLIVSVDTKISNVGLIKEFIKSR